MRFDLVIASSFKVGKDVVVRKCSKFLLLLLSLLPMGMGCVKAPIVKSFQTPEQTFETWREAARRLDLETLLACYASGAQSQMRKEISSNSEEGLKSMQKEAEDTDFKVEKIVFEDKRAYLRVSRKRAKAEDIEVINMVKEGPDWKIIP